RWFAAREVGTRRNRGRARRGTGSVVERATRRECAGDDEDEGEGEGPGGREGAGSSTTHGDLGWEWRGRRHRRTAGPGCSRTPPPPVRRGPAGPVHPLTR